MRAPSPGRTARAACLFLVAALALATPLRAADSAEAWLDRAADTTLTLREREYAARRVIMLADSSASIIISALRGDGSDSALRRQVAARILGEIGTAEAEGPLLEAAFDRDYFLSEAAAAALASLYSRRGDGELYTLLKRGLPKNASLRASGDPAADPAEEDWLALSLDSARTRGRFRGLVMRGIALKYDGGDKPMPPHLVQCIWDGLLDADAELRLHALRAAVHSGSGDAAERVAAFLYTENNAKLLVEGLRAMAAMRPPHFWEAVERHTGHDDAMVALEALAALDAMGSFGALFPNEAGQRCLAGYVSHPSTPVRRRAIFYLAASKDPAALEYLSVALFDRVAANRAAAARALGELGFAGAAGVLNPLLGDGHPEVRAEAAVALARLGVVGVAARVLDELEKGSPPFRRKAAEALGRMGDVRAVRPLASLLSDADSELACLAAEALGRLGDNVAAEELYATMVTTPNVVLADTARRALWAIFDDDPGMTRSSWEAWGRRNGY